VDELDNNRILKELHWINQLKQNFDGLLEDELDNNIILKETVLDESDKNIILKEF
jgi:hypothetical protein